MTHVERPQGNGLPSLRQEIAARAARLVAEDGLDYATAKRKAARDILGDQRSSGQWLPDNEEIEEEVRSFQATFQADTQPRRLADLRKMALLLMELLQPFRPHLAGAVLNGTAGAHSDIHLQLFADSAKDVEIFLINHGIDFEAEEMSGSPGSAAARRVEVLHFMWRPGRAGPSEGVHLTVYGVDDLRRTTHGLRRVERADLATAQKLFLHTDNPL